jgi:hypothetical protein
MQKYIILQKDELERWVSVDVYVHFSNPRERCVVYDRALSQSISVRKKSLTPFLLRTYCKSSLLQHHASAKTISLLLLSSKFNERIHMIAVRCGSRQTSAYLERAQR